MVGIGALATQFFKKDQGKGKGAAKGQSIFAPESAIYTPDGQIRRSKPRDRKGHRPSSADEKSVARSSRSYSDASSSSSTHHTSSSRDQGDHHHRHRRQQTKRYPPSSSSRHSTTPKRSRESSYDQDRSRGSAGRRGGLRKYDRDYDSGYASEDLSSVSPESRTSSRHGTSRKKAGDGRSRV